MRFRTFRLFIGRMGEKMKSPLSLSLSEVQGLCLFLLLAACGLNEQDRGKLPTRREPVVVDEERKAQQAEEEAKERSEAGEPELPEPEAEEPSPAIRLTTQTVSIPSLGASLHGVVTSGDSVSPHLVILLHEEGSNLHEFDELTRSLVSLPAVTLAVDLRHGGETLGFSNQTVINRGGQDSSFQSLVYDIEAIVRWSAERYTMISVVATSVTAGALLKAARFLPLLSKLALFSTPDYVAEAGEAIYRYIAQIFKPIFVAAPESERAMMDRLLGGTIATQIDRHIYASEGRGIAVLQNSDALHDLLAFLVRSS